MINKRVCYGFAFLLPMLSACGPDRAPEPGPPSRMQWFPEGKDVSTKVDGDALRVSGDDTRFGYQIGSAGIPLHENKQVRLTIDYSTESGRVCVGVLDAPKSNWLSINSDPGPELLFQSGRNPQVFVVMANCNEKDSGNSKSIFNIKSIRFDYVEKP